MPDFPKVTTNDADKTLGDLIKAMKPGDFADALDAADGMTQHYQAIFRRGFGRAKEEFTNPETGKLTLAENKINELEAAVADEKAKLAEATKDQPDFAQLQSTVTASQERIKVLEQENKDLKAANTKTLQDVERDKFLARVRAYAVEKRKAEGKPFVHPDYFDTIFLAEHRDAVQVRLEQNGEEAKYVVTALDPDDAIHAATGEALPPAFLEARWDKIPTAFQMSPSPGGSGLEGGGSDSASKWEKIREEAKQSGGSAIPQQQTSEDRAKALEGMGLVKPDK